MNPEATVKPAVVNAVPAVAPVATPTPAPQSSVAPAPAAKPAKMRKEKKSAVVPAFAVKS